MKTEIISQRHNLMIVHVELQHHQLHIYDLFVSDPQGLKNVLHEQYVIVRQTNFSAYVLKISRTILI